MVRRHTTALRASLIAADVIGAAMLFVIVSMARYGADWQADWNRLGIDPLLAAAAYGLGWAAVIWLQGLYRVRARYALRSEALAVIRAGIVLGLALVLYLFLVHVSNASRLLIGGLLLASMGLAIASRVLLRSGLAYLRRRGRLTRFVLIAGAGPAAQQFADRIERHVDLGLRVIGHLRGPGEEPASPSRPVLGSLDDIEDVLHERVVDEIAICLPVAAWNFVEPITALSASEGKIVRIPADGGPSVAGGYSEDFDGQTVVSLVYGPDRALGLLAKRLIDVLAAVLAVALASPLLLGVALYLRRTEGAPVIYRQTRVGLNGRPFELLKFRTMVPDADRQVAQLELFNEVRGRAFKMTNDPRLTRSGRWLRRTSIDELPQLWNVLRGEMSLVGPRPPLPVEVQDYDVWHRRRLSMKPGMTGLWQVSARHEPDFDRWVERDLEYIDRWSLWLDLKILARTVPVVVSLQGR
jgi:exopolysaccharide biosynthesis polyprenyl glycosylphosphotransferase